MRPHGGREPAERVDGDEDRTAHPAEEKRLRVERISERTDVVPTAEDGRAHDGPDRPRGDPPEPAAERKKDGDDLETRAEEQHAERELLVEAGAEGHHDARKD